MSRPSNSRRQLWLKRLHAAELEFDVAKSAVDLLETALQENPSLGA
jgi:hypothetical protein